MKSLFQPLVLSILLLFLSSDIQSQVEHTINYHGCLSDGYNITVNGTLYDATNPSGVETFPNAASDGSDSIVYVNLAFNAPAPFIQVIENSGTNSNDGNVCTGDGVILTALNTSTYASAYLWSTGEETSNINVFQPGEYTVTMSDYYGCTASTSYHLNHLPLPTPSIIVEENSGILPNDGNICGWDNATLHVFGDYSDYLWSSFHTSSSITVGQGNTYSVTVTDMNGCTNSTSVDIINNSGLYHHHSYQGCSGDGYSITLNGNTYDENQTYGTEYLQSSMGCDSIVIINLHFEQPEGYEIYHGCMGDGHSISINGNTYDENNPTGTEILSGASANGCDSTIYIQLQFYPEPIGTESHISQLGSGYIVTVNGNTYNEANPTGTEVLTSYLGCDSTVTINLQFMNAIHGSLDYDGCSGDGYEVTINGNTYNEGNPNGTEILAGAASSGLDSVVHINLDYTIVNPQINITETSGFNTEDAIICPGDAVMLEVNTFQSQIWSTGATSPSITTNSAGDYTVTVTNSNGCTGSSTVNVQSAPTPVFNTSITDYSGQSINDGIICDGDIAVMSIIETTDQLASYTWAMGEITSSAVANFPGDFTVTVTNVQGCTATAEFNISTQPNYVQYETHNGCSGDGYEITINGNTYNETNPYGVETTSGTSGCDTITYIQLEYHEAVGHINYTGCIDFGYSVTVNGTIYDDTNPTGTETIIGGSYWGCDSTVHINLTYTGPTVGYETYIGCYGDGYDIHVNNNHYGWSNPFGVEVIPFGSYTGCDSTIYINLIFNPPINETIEYTGQTGDGYELDVNGTIYNEANPTGTEVLSSIITGCDSIITINLTFNPVGTNIIDYVGCSGDGYSTVLDGITYDENNPTDTITIANGSYLGIDSIIIIDLVFHEHTTSNFEYHGCEGDGYEIYMGGTYYNELNPTGIANLVNVNGCDSIVTINLTFTPSSVGYLDYLGCEGDGYGPIVVNGSFYYESNPSGIEVIPNGSYTGCDSVVIIELVFETPQSNTSINEQHCPGSGYSITVNGTVYDETNPVGVENIPVGSGCDSTVSINLIFAPPSGEATYTGCYNDGYSETINGTVYDQFNPTGTELIPNGSYTGCDSIININFTYVNGAVGNFTYNGCSGDGYTVQINGMTYDENNPTGTELIQNSSYLGCDSIVLVNLDFSCTSTEYPSANTTYQICNGIFTDSGGSTGNYSNSESIYTTICSENGEQLSLTFTAFETEGGFDILYVYDGPNASSALLGEYSGFIGNDFTVSSSGNCLTFHSISDGSVSYPGWEASISCSWGDNTQIGQENHVGCEGDNYSILINGTIYDEDNPSGIEFIQGGAYNGLDTATIVELVFLPPYTSTESYAGQMGDGYNLEVNGTLYNESNPTGTEIIIAENGCDSIIYIDFTFYPESTNVVEYSGCTGDGYQITLNGITYNELNPSGIDTLDNASYLGTDSIIIVDLYYHEVYVGIITDTDELGCLVDSTILNTNVFNANGNVSYIWSTQETTSSITVYSPGLYEVTITDDWGCSHSNGITIAEGPECNDLVFPGDANYDFVVNSYDHLTVCLAPGQTGIPRNDQGILWQPYQALDWNVQAVTGVDNKHLDCNGDGIINSQDLSAVDNNYNSMHNGINPLRIEGAPYVRLVFDTHYDLNDTDRTIVGQIVIDDFEDQGDVENLYGILFSLEYDPFFIQEGSLQIEYLDNAWLGNSMEVIPLYKDFYDQGQMDLAFTRGDLNSVTGSGVIANVQFTVNDPIIWSQGDFSIPLAVTNVYAHDHEATPAPFNTESVEISVTTISSTDDFLTENAINVYPNPTSGEIIVDTKQNLGKHYTIWNTLGQEIGNGILQQKVTSIHLKGQNPGVYFILISTEQGNSVRKIILE